MVAIASSEGRVTIVSGVSRKDSMILGDFGRIRDGLSTVICYESDHLAEGGEPISEGRGNMEGCGMFWAVRGMCRGTKSQVRGPGVVEWI